MKLKGNNLCLTWFALLCVLTVMAVGCSETVISSSDGDTDLESEVDVSIDGDSVEDDKDAVDGDVDVDSDLETDTDLDSEGSTESETDTLVCQPEAIWCEGTELHACNEDGTDEYIPEDCGPIGCENGACVEEHALDLSEWKSYAVLSDQRLTYGNDGTIEMWFSSQQFDRDSTILYSEGNVIAIALWNDGRISYQEGRVDIGWTSVKTVSYQFSFDTWHHLALTKTGQIFSFFLDGIKVHEGNGPPSDSVLIGGPRNTVAGGFLSTNHYCNALLDEIRISDNVRYTENFTPALRHNPDEHTLGLWHFDEGSGMVAHDSSSHGSDGTFEESVKWTTDGVWRNWDCVPQWGQCLPDSAERKVCNEDGFGWSEPADCGPIGCEDNACVEEYALSFVGEDDAIQIASSFLIRRLTEATIEMWVWLEDREETEEFTAHYLYAEGDPSRLYLGVYTNGQIYFSEHNPDDTWVNFPSAEGIFPFETWNHIAVTKDANKHVLYLNGEQVAERSIGIVPFDYSAEYPSVLSRKMYGYVDEVRLSSKVQYTENFTPVYRHSAGNSDEDIIGLWHFNNSGADESIKNNNIPTASCKFTDKAVWRNWECTSGWTYCASETTVDICNESGRWVEWKTCQSGDNCVSESQTDAMCVEQR